MIRIKYILTLSFIFTTSYLFSQKQNNIWYFGDKAGLNFNTNPPTTLNDGVFTHTEGVSSICDINGELLFFTNGIYVWNANRQIMPNGFGLLGNNSSSQILIVPQPGDCNIYYIFTTPSQTFLGTANYSVVDMRLDNGNGDVVSKNVFLAEFVTERISATLQTNGQDYWVMLQELGSNNFLAFSLTVTGLNTNPIVSSTGIPNASVNDAVGCMKFSSDGKILCTANELGIKKCQLFKFDSQTGIVSNGFVVSDNEGYGVEFSSDNSKLYIASYSKFKLTQYNLASNDPLTIKNSGVVLIDLTSSINEHGGTLQISSDNSIYVARDNKTFLGIIKNPNVVGLGCAYTNNAINLNGKLCYAGLPNFIKNFPSQFCGFLRANYTRGNLCAGNNISINVTATFGVGPYLYSLDNGLFQSSNTFTGLIANDYLITVQDAASNIRKITLKIPAVLNISLNSSSVTDSDCGISNGAVSLLPTNGTAPFQYSMDGLNYQTSSDFNNLPASTIHFFVKDNNGCIANKSVLIGTKSNLKVFAGRDTGIFINQTIGLFAKDLTNSNFISFKWTPVEGLDNAFIQNPTALITKDIIYTVEAANALGCSVTDNILIDVYKDIDIFVPTAFTPNGDFKNDLLRPIPRGIKEFKYFKIYNRYGSLVFATINFTDGWDGKLKGIDQNTGSYIWVSEGIDIKGNLISRKGTFTLLR